MTTLKTCPRRIRSRKKFSSNPKGDIGLRPETDPVRRDFNNIGPLEPGFGECQRHILERLSGLSDRVI
jgi:hypothetical protein